MYNTFSLYWQLETTNQGKTVSMSLETPVSATSLPSTDTRASLWSRLVPWIKDSACTGLALVTLYLCFYLLGFFALVPSLPKRQATLADRTFTLRVQGVRADPKDWTVAGEIIGQALPDTAVEVAVGKHTYTGRADSTGQVLIPVQVPDSPVEMRVFTRPKGKDLQLSTYLSHTGQSERALRPPVIDLALAEGEANLLWVAGRAAHFSAVRLETEAGDILGTLRTGNDGIFDDMLTLPIALPSTVVARMTEDYRALPPSVPVPVTHMPQLPFKRVLRIHFAEGVPVIACEATLPAYHPRFRAFAHGYLAAEGFISTIWGWYPSGIRPPISHTIALQGNVATVQLTGSWFGAVNELAIGDMYATGLGAQRLLAVADVVTVEFQEVTPGMV